MKQWFNWINPLVDLFGSFQLDKSYKDLSRQEKADLLMKLEREMKDAAKALDFETAATLRDTILELKAAK